MGIICGCAYGGLQWVVMAVAVLAAMSVELAPFLMGLAECSLGAGFDGRRVTFYRGSHGGHELVAARSGVGKVNAALAAQILIDRFAAEGIIQVGLAGALDGDLEIGDIVLGDRYVEHDCDLTRMGLAAGEVLFDVAVEGQGFGVEPGMRMGGFDASPRLLALAESAAREVLAGAGPAWGAARGPRVVKGTIVSGDQFIQSAAKGAWLRETFGAIAIEMESAAAAHVCQINGVQFLGIRAISDRADGSAHMDMASSLPVAAQHYHRIVMKILEAWSASAGQV